MISDVLSDAVSKIEYYQRDFGRCYDDLRPEIDAVREAMTRLRVKLDTPPQEQPSLSVVGGIQPDVVEGLLVDSPAVVADGMSERFQWPTKTA